MSESLAELEVLALEAAGGPERGLTPAELHGAAVGIGVANPGRFELQDLVNLLGADVLSDSEAVERFVSAALDALHASDMSFTLLLPDDDAPPNAAPAVQQNTPGDHTTCETCGDGDDRTCACSGEGVGEAAGDAALGH